MTFRKCPQKSVSRPCARVNKNASSLSAKLVRFPKPTNLIVCAQRALTRFFAVLIFFAVSLSIRAEPKFSASFDKDTVSMGESVELTLKFEDAQPRGQP